MGKTREYFESLRSSPICPIPSTEKPPILEEKLLPSHLSYAYLGSFSTLLVIISFYLSQVVGAKLLRVLREHKEAIAWYLANIKGIKPSMCMHQILLEADSKPTIEAQRWLNPTMKEVVRKEVLKGLDVRVIYPIFNYPWVSSVQVVPNKGGIIVIKNEINELILTRTVTGWRICIDYWKLNKAIKKDHFPFPFIDQMLDRLVGHRFYCFIEGYSGYNRISIALED